MILGFSLLADPTISGLVPRVAGARQPNKAHVADRVFGAALLLFAFYPWGRGGRPLEVDDPL